VDELKAEISKLEVPQVLGLSLFGLIVAMMSYMSPNSPFDIQPLGGKKFSDVSVTIGGDENAVDMIQIRAPEDFLSSQDSAQMDF